MLVTVTSHAGIANRIKNIMSALSQHESIGTLHETMSYIFPSLKKVESIINPYDEDWRLYVSPEEEKYIDNYKTIDLLYEKTPTYFIQKYLKVLSKLEINTEILNYVEDFTKDWNDMIGVHVRSWYCEKKIFHDNQIFKDQIDKLDPKKFFFCCDNSDVYTCFFEEYGNRMITYDRKMFNNPHLAESGHHDNLQITTDAFIELLILSKCDKIIGTYASSFDEVAWWFSKCKSEIIIPKPINCEEHYNNLNNLIYIKK